LLLAGNNLQESTLSGTVLSNKSNAVFLVYDEADIVEQVCPAKINPYVV
jgi:hypothetical protein